MVHSGQQGSSMRMWIIEMEICQRNLPTLTTLLKAHLPKTQRLRIATKSTSLGVLGTASQRQMDILFINSTNIY